MPQINEISWFFLASKFLSLFLIFLILIYYFSSWSLTSIYQFNMKFFNSLI